MTAGQEQPGIGKRFADKVALVTGAGQGIGEATAFRLAAEGASIGVLDINGETAADAAHAVRERGGRAVDLVADVADTVAVAQAVNKLRKEFGSIDVLVNNAGFDRPGGFLKIAPDDFLAVWGVHVLGAVNCCRAVAPVMFEQGGRRYCERLIHLRSRRLQGRSSVCFGKGRTGGTDENPGP